MPIAEIAVVPIGTDDASMSDTVARAHEAAHRRGIKHQVTPMSTVLEGPLNELFDCAREMHEAALRSGCPRVVTSFTIDERTDQTERTSTNQPD